MTDIEPYYSDQEVALLLDPSGKRIKARSIRSERDAGRLVGTRVAGKWMYRKSDVVNFLETARRCPNPKADPTSSSCGKRDGSRGSSTSPTEKAAAADGLQRVFLPPTLTRRMRGSASGSGTAPEPKGPAQVIPIKSGSPT
jgi:hypothetical protein